MKILFLSTSFKYGKEEGIPSAIENCVDYLFRSMPNNFSNVGFSFRNFPKFSLPDSNSHKIKLLEELRTEVKNADLIVLGCTAYLRSLSASSKAFFEYCNTPNYDSAESELNLLKGKNSFAVVVGLNQRDASFGVAELVEVSSDIGLNLLGIRSYSNVRINQIDLNDLLLEFLSVLKEEYFYGR